MPGTYLGLDPTAVRQLASNLNNVASEIQNLASQLTNQLQNTAWTGPDREQFVGEWQGTHMSQLHTVINALQDASQKATQNATQQEQASNS
jgi:uncharacterized protein YukE